MNKKELYRQIADKSELEAHNQFTKISFKYVLWDNNSFFLHGGTSEYYQQLISCFQRILETRVSDWKANGSLGKFIKPIDWHHETITQSKFNPPIESEEMLHHCFEIRLTKNHGRVHGFLHMGSFFIVWFDPCHNLFPGTDGGKGKKLAKQQYKQITNVNIEKINSLTNELEEVRSELNDYKEIYDPK